MPNAPHIPQAATDRAWDLVEELIFDRIAPPRRAAGAVAAAVGVSDPTFRGWEEGDWLPGLGAFVAWAHALDYDVVLVPRGE